MKKFRKIISAALAAAVALTAFAGLTVSAEGNITAARLKELAESRKLIDRPDAEQILDYEYAEGKTTFTLEDIDKIDPITREYVYDITEERPAPTKIGDIPGIETAFLCGPSAEVIAEGLGNGKSFDEIMSEHDNQYCIVTDQKSPALNDPPEGPYTGAVTKEINVNYYAADENGDLREASKAEGSLRVDFHDTSVFDFGNAYDKIADALIDAGCKSVDDACIESGTGISVSTDIGCMYVPVRDLSGKVAEYIGENIGDINAFEAYKIGDYVKFLELRDEASLKASELLGKKLREKMPDSLDTNSYKPDTTFGEATDCFSKYIGTEPQYSDISDGQAAVTNQLTDMGIINGSDGKFRPNDNVTRAETAAIICRLLRIEPNITGKFDDVPDEYWAAGYIGALAEQGMIDGTADGLFSPEESVTYEQALKIIITLLGYAGNQTDYYGGFPTGFFKLCSFDSGGAISRIELACVISRALDTRLSTTTVGVGGFGAQIYEIADVTLYGYLNGAELRGELLRGADEKEAFKERKSAEYAEKCGGIIDEFKNITQSSMTLVKEINGIMVAKLEKYNPVPRSTT